MKFRNLLTLAIASSMCSTTVLAQKGSPENWFNLDKATDGINGVSAEKMYKELLKGKKSTMVVVAVIDGGVDYNHEDLKDVMWKNSREIPNNGIDDDKNGYIDDIYGWNFIGGADGKNVHHETLEITRKYASLRKKYANVNPTSFSKKEKADYDEFIAMQKQVEDELAEAKEALEGFDKQKQGIMSGITALEKALDGKKLTKENVDAVKAGDNENLKRGKSIYTNVSAQGDAPEDFTALRKEMNEYFESVTDYYTSKAKYQYNPDYDSRKEIVKDNYEDATERFYGNNDVKGPDAGHGTHVAGIIAASRKNGVGMDGVADNVRIMAIRCVPDGDERDKDVANSIRYAVDNGATVINMSFGKSVSWNKRIVDDAVKYAAKKDVLLIHAAGNDSKDNDAGFKNFPMARYEKRGWFSAKKAKNWIEVGALSWKKGEDLPANFTNYGQEQVDVFAPGVDIYSTMPENTYKKMSGTSMASPVTAGVAAVVRSYYPELTAQQVKEVIEGSVVKQTEEVKKPGSKSEKIAFSKLSKTGGVVNAFEAVKTAAMVKGKKKLKRA